MSLAVSSMAAAAQLGTFALQGGAARVSAYLDAQPMRGKRTQERLRFWMAPQNGRGLVKSYDVDMTKRLHVLIISDDFRTFLHVHPTLGADGQFRLDQSLPRATLYHVYADAMPRGFGQQVFRFDLHLGNARSAARDLSERSASTASGPYRVTLSTLNLKAGEDATLAVHVTKNGAPAKDLRPYLGALAHAVFLNANDLSYAHVHPMPLGSKPMQGMDMSRMDNLNMQPLPAGAASSPDMALHVSLKEPGTYKLWLQFQGGDHLHVAPFVLTAK